MDYNISFEDINLDKYKKEVSNFRIDSYVLSFGTKEALVGVDGKGVDRYLTRLAQRSTALKGSCVHVKIDNKVIGQIETSKYEEDENSAYINLFYLTPAYRGLGLGKHLEKYAIDYFKLQKFNSAYLTVSPVNKAAIAFYKKLNWVDLGIEMSAAGLIIKMKKVL